jgi:hypothetical protein
MQTCDSSCLSKSIKTIPPLLVIGDDGSIIFGGTLIVSTFYDNAKKVIDADCAFSNADVLRPAEKSSFEIILNNAVQSQKVSSYKLTVSGDKTEAKGDSM